MKKVFILDYSWEKKLFINFNNLKKYLKENIFSNLNISKKEITNQISLLNYKKVTSWEWSNFEYIFNDIKIYSIWEYGKIL